LIGASGHEFLQESAQEQQDGHHGSRRILANGNGCNGGDGNGNVRCEVELTDALQSRPPDVGGAYQGGGQIEYAGLVLGIIMREIRSKTEYLRPSASGLTQKANRIRMLMLTICLLHYSSGRSHKCLNAVPLPKSFRLPKPWRLCLVCLSPQDLLSLCI
jgi:hypothetical protein